MREIGVEELRRIAIREWHLWTLAFVLISFLGGLAAAAYFFFLGDFLQEFGLAPSTAHRALGGLMILILLFCAYVIQTRLAFARMQTVIERQSTQDELTHLYNRRYFSLRIEEEIARADRSRALLGLLVCDLDHFKAVNDLHGQQAGDEALKEVARKIQQCVRNSDLVFRWEGDEFIVVLPDVRLEGIRVAANRIRREVLNLGERTLLPLDLSVGIALFPEHGRTTDQLIALAERALYLAKKGGDKVHIGEEEYHLDEHTVKTVFQPIVDAFSDQVLGYEALARDPQGKLAVLELFRKYEAVGRLTDLKCICFKSSLRVAEEVGLERVFLNIDFQLLRQLGEIAKPSGMQVILEISEAEALNKVKDHLDVVGAWRKAGYQFAIDDFGAGFISLPFLAQLLPEFIKLDRSAVLHAVESSQFRAFLKKLIPALRMYATEGMIAEGIETEEELKVVKELGIFIVQGFLLGKPQELKMPGMNRRFPPNHTHP